MQIGEKIYQLRKTAGITQEQLASHLNVSRQTVSKWESGGSVPDIDSVVKISKLFQISLDELLLDDSAETVEEQAQGEEDTSTSALEKLVKVNRRNWYITVGVVGVFIFLLGVILGSIFMTELKNATSRMEYSLYRQIEMDEHKGAVIEINAERPVFLVTDATYEDRGVQASIYCDVYYLVGDKVKKLGELYSAGTAYPIAYDSQGIYVASGHSVLRYTIDEEKGVLLSEEGIEAVDEAVFVRLYEAYSNATVVNFE